MIPPFPDTKKQRPRHIMSTVVCCFPLPSSANLDAVPVSP